jgi:membrane associated rhomboid family serine protease
MLESAVAKFRISYNAPVVLTFAVIATAVQALSKVFGESWKLWFASWPEFHGFRSYPGLVTHIFGHADWNHLLSNFTLILLVGPILEERHGSKKLLTMIVVTALITGFVNVIFANQFLVGASGIAFMMVLLASTANIARGEIPLTFIAVAFLFLGREVISAFSSDNISQMAHLLGGVAGAAFGFLTAAKPSATAKDIASAARMTTAQGVGQAKLPAAKTAKSDLDSEP